ncbi:MAG: phosphotransferase [Acidimicrobiales bacterium]
MTEPDPVHDVGPSGTAPADPRFRSGPPARQPAPGTDLVAAAEASGVAARATWTLAWVRRRCDVWSVAAVPGAAPVAFVKHGCGPEVLGLQGETQRLQWLGDRLRGRPDLVSPTVVGARDLDDGYLLATAALDGIGGHEIDAHQLSAPRLADTLGRALATLHHALDPQDCPWAVTVSAMVAAAEARLAAGGLQSDQLPEPFLGRDPADAVRWLGRHVPAEPDDGGVVTHGDAGLPNLLVPVEPDGPIAIIDVGRLGVSDRYRDLSVLVRSFAANHGARHQERLGRAYGVDGFDAAALDWWRIADDLW